tara:strand:+ start:11253 stop:11771 length:519 start_codon:yes stop_codon:yes gene_type:complete
MQSFEEYYSQQMIEEGKLGKAFATGALAAGLMASQASASIFNNNPGNIRTSPTNWNGEVTEPGEEFERFSDMHMGVRASARILRTYGKKYGIDTINKIIDRYAPPEDNNPNNANYARHVSNGSGFDVDEKIDLNDPEVLMKLMRPIFQFENGQKEAAKISDADIQKGVRMAF